MNKPDSNNALENSWNEMTETFQNQFTAWLRISENYFDHMSEGRKKVFQDIRKHYSFDNTKANPASSNMNITEHKAKKEGRREANGAWGDTIEGNWKQLMGDVKKQWSKLSNDTLIQINGSRKKLADAIQESYGTAHKEAETQMREWENMRAKASKNSTY